MDRAKTILKPMFQYLARELSASIYSLSHTHILRCATRLYPCIILETGRINRHNVFLVARSRALTTTSGLVDASETVLSYCLYQEAVVTQHPLKRMMLREVARSSSCIVFGGSTLL